MPNVLEMLSLVCFGTASPVLTNAAGDGQWKESDPFLGVHNEQYWTSTSQEPNSVNRYLIDLNDGLLKTDFVGAPEGRHIERYLGSDRPHFVWPVRGGVVQREKKQKGGD